MNKQYDPERKRREAFRLSNDLMVDLIAGGSTHFVLRTLFRRGGGEVPVDVQTAAARLCLFHTIISLSKWVELYDRYRDVIPAGVRDLAKNLRNDIYDRGIVDFRNKVAGHIWDDEKGRALTSSEVEERLVALADSDVEGFLHWAAEPTAATDATSPVSVIERVRDSIKNSYGFTDDDLQR